MPSVTRRTPGDLQHRGPSPVRTPAWPDREVDPVRLQGCDENPHSANSAAGSGYDYLTRQVAALDATETGHVGLAAYYSERGEIPGSWIGSDLVGIDGLNAGDPVTAEEMRALFGAGLHPLAAQRLEQLGTADLTAANVQAATQLGAPFKVYAGEVSPFRIELTKWLAARQAAVGQLADESVSAALRAQVRTEVARGVFSSCWMLTSSPASEQSMAAIRSMPARSRPPR